MVQFKANLLSTEAKELDAETQEAKRQRLAAQQFVFGYLFSWRELLPRSSTPQSKQCRIPKSRCAFGPPAMRGSHCLSVLKRLPSVFNKLSARLASQCAVEVQVAWRCNCELWWVALVPHDEVQPYYEHLGYSQTEVEKFLQNAVNSGADKVQPGTGQYPADQVQYQLHL